MSETTIEQLRIPDSLDGDLAADFLEAVEVSRLVRRHTWGNDELAYTAEELFDQCHDPYEWYVVLVARKGGAIVGRAGIALPLDDNTELAHVTLDVLPTAEGMGLGRKLLEAAETFVRGENRQIVMVETNHPAATLEEGTGDPIPATHGSGVLPMSSREARFAFSAGYDLEQVEQFSACALPVRAGLTEELAAKAARTHNSGYAIHQWVDSCPEEWAQDIARLEQSLGPDGVAQEPWDVARLREAEELSVLTGRHSMVSAAECLETGALVAFTSISILGHRSDVAFQDDTVVELSHKGKDVGLLIKVSNMDQLVREFPQARTVYTWNAPENSYMLSVNAELGYVSAGMTGQWRKDFNAV
ncbi:GNAT family N-acetyltransferase [Arthrobacter sp. LAPM80]|uniref:GNAT family N-acetyltransferase n=1 Tax=Arthrobacter sp. LAPM80 TaxID=3141788 RepID=UPI00398B10F0